MVQGEEWDAALTPIDGRRNTQIDRVVGIKIESKNPRLNVAVHG